MEFIVDASRYIDKLDEAIDEFFRKWMNEIQEEQVKNSWGADGASQTQTTC